MKELKYYEAINEALREEMKRDENVIIIGEEVGVSGGAYKCTSGLYDEFGSERLIDTPISEAAIVGVGIGASLMGLRPVTEIMYMDFIHLSVEQIMNHAAKMYFMSGGQYKLPLVIRTQYSLGRAYGPQHSQFFPSWFLNTPGLYIALPSTPYDAKGLLKAAIRANDPTVFIECAGLYYKLKGPIPGEDETVPLGKADVKKEGDDVTVIAISRMVHEALAAADELEKKGLSVEVVDPRTLSPLDKETIIKSVKKTGRVVVAADDCKTGGVSNEIACVIIEEAFNHLKAPIQRLAAADMPAPSSRELEQRYMPTKARVVKAISQIK
jgi:pyruvate/2-oxoglutarate/acetoin dehydrogenase E1 component